MKKALITGITGQNGAYRTEFLIAKDYEIHEKNRHLVLRHGNLTDATNLIRILKQVQAPPD